MATWDIMHVKSLDVEHSVPEDQIVQGLKEGSVSRDDTVRRTGSDDWRHIYEVSEFRQALMALPLAAPRTSLPRGGSPKTTLLETELIEPEPELAAEGEAPRVEGASLRDLLSDVEPVEAAPRPKPRPVPPIDKTRPDTPPKPTAAVPKPKPELVLEPAGEAFPRTERAESAEAGEALSYGKRHHEPPEELDMTPMVDVAMQLILFFMVTSAMVLQSAIEFPKPAPDEGQRSAREIVHKLEDFKVDNVLIKIKADNSIWLDEEKSPTKESELTDKLARFKRERALKGVVISAEDAAYHQTVVAALDAANVAEFKEIKMASPKKTEKKKRAPTKKRTIKE